MYEQDTSAQTKKAFAPRAVRPGSSDRLATANLSRKHLRPYSQTDAILCRPMKPTARYEYSYEDPTSQPVLPPLLFFLLHACARKIHNNIPCQDTIRGGGALLWLSKTRQSLPACEHVVIGSSRACSQQWSRLVQLFILIRRHPPQACEPGTDYSQPIPRGRNTQTQTHPNERCRGPFALHSSRSALPGRLALPASGLAMPDIDIVNTSTQPVYVSYRK